MAERQRPAFVGVSAAMRDVIIDIERAARTDARILITGESGVGKEIAARLLHQLSPRSAQPLVTINCAGIPDSLLESELFGHVRGSFTGAFRDRPGLLDVAHGGSIFMDEVGEMSLRLQGALLRFLETGEIQRVGAAAIQTRVDVRLIAATNRDLLERIAEREFREDLYYRLNVINITIPPLRARREDIPVLLRHYFALYADGHGVRSPGLTPEALARLVAYDWPGNVRQLRNFAERIVLRPRSGEIGVVDLPPEIGEFQARPQDAINDEERPLADVVFDRMIVDRDSFWAVPYAMFMARELTRTDMREIIEKGLRRTSGHYKDLPELFNIPASDYKRLLSFLRQQKCHVAFQPFRQAAASGADIAAARRDAPTRRWPRKPISTDLPALLASSRARVRDMSYGGFKLAFGDERDLPEEFDVTLPDAGLTIKAHRVWSRPSPAADEFWCGVELIDQWMLVDTQWREFVDAAH